MRKKAISPLGETLESFLQGVGLRKKVYDAVVKRVNAWQKIKSEQKGRSAPRGKI
jgi:hypothetical protein